MKAMLAAMLVALCLATAVAAPPEGEGWTPLFNGRDFTGWKFPAKAKGSWTVTDDGVMDYDAKAGVTLWTEKGYKDFVLHIEWRLKTAKELYGSDVDADGKKHRFSPDSGIFHRGMVKAQTNIWPASMGSGEVWGFRVDKNLPEAIRKACVPKLRADNPLGEWNVQENTLKGEHLTVVLNGKTVIDTPLPGIKPEGPLGLQHHGAFDKKTGRWNPASSCIQFRNIYIKELK